VMAPTLAPTRPTTCSRVTRSPRCRMRGPMVQVRRILSRTWRMRNRSRSGAWATRCIQPRYPRSRAREVTCLNRIASIRIYLWPRTDCGATISSNWLLVSSSTAGPAALASSVTGPFGLSRVGSAYPQPGHDGVACCPRALRGPIELTGPDISCDARYVRYPARHD